MMVDAHSKWPEAFVMSSTTVSKTLDILRHVFAAYGFPEQLVSDNGPQFIADEFATFLKLNGVKHVRSAPYHPAYNGLGERFVQSMKTALKVSKGDGRSLNHRLSSFLFTYWTSPHATTGVSPSSMFWQHNVRTRFYLLRPNTEAYVLDQHRSWFVGQAVMARNLRPGPDGSAKGS